MRMRLPRWAWPGSLSASLTLIDAEWWLYVQTATGRAACPAGGTWATAHDCRRVKVRDLPISGRPVVLVWPKRI